MGEVVLEDEVAVDEVAMRWDIKNVQEVRCPGARL